MRSDRWSTTRTNPTCGRGLTASAFGRHIAAEDDLRRLLEERREGNEQMITMIRAAAGH
jgi:hypothetical protein